MIAMSRIYDPPRTLRWVFIVLVVMACGAGGLAQTTGPAPEALRQQIERRFEVLPLREGVGLRPRTPSAGVRLVEVTDGTIAIDGAPASGAELRDKLGADADLVLQLSYLDAQARRQLFGPVAEAPLSTTPSVPPMSTPPGVALPPPQPRPPAPPGVEPTRSRRSGDRIRIGGSVTVDEDEYIDGAVVAVGGSAHIMGEVRDDVVAIGGIVELGPNASVDGEVTVVGAGLRRAPTARVRGEIHEIGIGGIDLSEWRWTPRGLGDLWWSWTLGSAFALMSTLGRVAVLCLLAALVVMLGREYVERISARAADEPLKAGAIGILAQLLFLPVLIITIVVLVVTIIGIPLLVLVPFAILGLGIVALVGFTAVSQTVGRVLGARLGWTTQSAYATTIAGILLLLSPLILARLLGLAGGPLYPMSFGLGLIGICVEYLAWTVGFGAVALMRFGRTVTPSSLA